jgi:hypothetical protein
MLYSRILLVSPMLSTCPYFAFNASNNKSVNSTCHIFPCYAAIPSILLSNSIAQVQIVYFLLLKHSK